MKGFPSRKIQAARHEFDVPGAARIGQPDAEPNLKK
jgi:hypothetical protein